jgi:hypothetical protein
VTIAQLGIEYFSPFRLNRAGGAREESDIDLFFDYKKQKGKVGLFDLVDVKEPSRSSSTMTRAFCQLSAGPAPAGSFLGGFRTPALTSAATEAWRPVQSLVSQGDA